MPPNTNQVRFTNVFKFLCNILSGCRDTHEELKNKTFWKLDIRLKYTRTWKFFGKLWKSQNTQHTHTNWDEFDRKKCWLSTMLYDASFKSRTWTQRRWVETPNALGSNTIWCENACARSIRLCEEITRLIRKNKLVSDDSCRVLGMRKKIYIVK